MAQVNDMWVYTNIETDGKITDTCEGDSGGPLAVQKGDRWELVGVLQVINVIIHVGGTGEGEGAWACNGDVLALICLISFQGEGFDCRTNTSSGFGSWNNVAHHNSWIKSQLSFNALRGVQNSQYGLNHSPFR